MTSRSLVCSPRTWLISLGLLTALTGCSLLPEPTADPTRHYVLTGLPLGAERPAKVQHTMVVGLKRIEVPSYLNGKDLVVRTEGNEISYHGFARWAEPLSTSISRALTDHLDASAKIARVYAQPFLLGEARDYDLAITITRCEGERRADGRTIASFVAVFELISAKPGRAVVLRKTFVAPETAWDGSDFGALATALSAGVTALGVDIENAIPAR